MDNGYILIHRKLLDWEWYSNSNDTRLFIHCLLKANWKEGKFKGFVIPRGSFVTSINNLVNETGLTTQQIKTSIKHLKVTNEITIKTNNHFSIITINKYNDYQLNNIQTNKQITNNQQTSNNNRININKGNELNNNMNIIINNWNDNVVCDEINKGNNEKCLRRSTYNINGKNYCNQHSKSIIKNILEFNDCFKKPSIEEIELYCKERNNNVDPNNFYDFYESKDWFVGKNKMKDWKAAVRTWEQRDNNNKLPSWFNKKPEERKLTDEEQRQLDELIRGY